MEDFKASEFGVKNADYFEKNLKTFDDQEASHRWFCPFIVWKISNVHILLVHSLGLTPWNLSCFEFKFDDARLSSQYENKIGPIEIFV